MNGPLEIVRELRDRGIALFIVGDELRYRAPKGALTEELRELLQRHKPGLIQFLARAGITAVYRQCPPYPDGTGLVKCFYCTRLVQGVCNRMRVPMHGISLLRECRYFIMRGGW